MNEKIKQIITDSLKDYKIEKIILFGSRARGDFNSESDYDIYLVLKEELSHLEKTDLIDIILENLAKENICADVLISTKKVMETYKNISGTVTSYVNEEGIEL